MQRSTGVSTEQLDRDWLYVVRESLDKQITTALQAVLSVHQWSIALISGLLAASISVPIEADASHQYTFVGLTAAVLLNTRLFMRSCVEISRQHRWQRIRELIDRYLMHQGNDVVSTESILEKLKDHYFSEYSVLSFRQIAWRSLQAAFLLLYALILLLWVLAVHTGKVNVTTRWVIAFGILWLILEILFARAYRGFRLRKPKSLR